MAHAFEDEATVMIHAVGAALEREGKNCGKAGRSLAIEGASAGFVVVLRR